MYTIVGAVMISGCMGQMGLATTMMNSSRHFVIESSMANTLLSLTRLVVDTQKQPFEVYKWTILWTSKPLNF